MLYLCLKYRVSDFVQWHKTFMMNETLRVASGIKFENILRSHNDRNFLTILYAIDSIEQAEIFLEKARSEKMQKDLTLESEFNVEYFDVFY